MAEPNASFSLSGICAAEDGCVELYGSPQATTFQGSVTDGDIELVCSLCHFGAVSGKGPESGEKEAEKGKSTPPTSSKS